MRLTILHLSDIHFKTTGNPVSSRPGAIVSGLKSLDPSPDAVLTVVSGDIAYSGIPEEYTVATKFFADLRNAINDTGGSAQIAFASVPGNHDCKLPLSAVKLRKALINGIIPSIETAKPDADILKELLSAQDGYFGFDKNLAAEPDRACPWLCTSKVLNWPGVRVHVNLYNTAVVSQRDEAAASLRVPMEVFERDILASDNSSLVVAVIHHSYPWLEPNNGARLRAHIDQHSDLVLSGHQHLEHSYVKQALSGEHDIYLEGAALQDEDRPTESAFNVIQCDFAEQKQRIIHFKWRKDMYVPVQDSGWGPTVANRTFRHSFRVSPDFRRFLDDPGVGYSHVRRPNLNLRDIYVYPDLLVRKTQPKSQPRDIPGEKLGGYIRGAEYVVFEGPGLSGRTSLAKIIFSDTLSMGFVPLFFEARAAWSGSEAALTKLFWKFAEEQYSAEMLERFKQLGSPQRVLIVDNWDRAGLSPEGRACFLSTAKKYFGKVFVFSDPMFEAQEFATASKDKASLLQFEHATINEFGHKARGKLIERWLTLGREHNYDRKELIREIDELEKVMTTVLGKNTLPKLPFIVLSVLQAYQENMTSRPEAGSYGYVYEVLITTALAASAKSPSDIDKKYTLLSRLAYGMFKQDVDSISRDDLSKVFEDYFEEYGLRDTTSEMLNDLEKARVISGGDGSYRFTYDYYLEYFVARYYKDALQTGSVSKDQSYSEIYGIVDQIYWARYSKIIMFLLYFSKDMDVLSRLIKNAQSIFDECAPADLNQDVEFANGLYKVPLTPELPSEDVRAYRERRRESLDRAEKQIPDQGGERLQYSNHLQDSKKMGIALKHIELLGQILKNFPGSLRAGRKLDIALCTYMLGLRTMSVLLRLVGGSVGHYRALIADALEEEGPEPSGECEGDGADDAAVEIDPELWKKVGDLADATFLLLTKVCVLGLIKFLSFSLGSRELDQTYNRVLESLPGSMPVKLIDLSIRLDHFPGFPQHKVQELDRSAGKNIFVHDVLSDLVIIHFMLFEVDWKIRQRMASLLGFRASGPQLLSGDRKLLRSKAGSK
jgi:hypothetical protein